MQCLKTGLLSHDIGHIIFDHFFIQATKKDFKLNSDLNESVFASAETVVKDVMKNNLFLVVDTLLGENVGFPIHKIFLKNLFNFGF